MAVLRLVVDRGAALHDALQRRSVEGFALRAARQTSSASVSPARPSPSAMPISDARASLSSGSVLPSVASARAESFSSAAASSGLNTNPRAGEQRRNQLNDGFSVVAPTNMTVPSSITGRNESCCARLKR